MTEPAAPSDPPTPRAPEGVPRPVKGLALVSLCNDFASEMVYPLLPAFVTRTLGGGALALGALDGAADLAAGLTRLVSGALADRPGRRKPLVLAGYFAAVVVRPVIALTGAAWQVIGLRVADRVGKGIRSPARDAMIAGLTPRERQGRAFGYHRAADHLGAVAGSLTAWFLLQQAVPVRSVIGWSIVPGLLVLAILSVVLRAAPETAPTARRVAPSPAAPADARGVAFWGPVAALVLLTVARLPETLLLLRLQDLGVAVPMIPLVWAGLHVVRSAGAYPGGWLTDRLGPRGTVAAGGVLGGVILVLLAMSLGPAAAIVVFLFLGLVAGLTEAAERTVVARLAPVRTARGFGTTHGLAALAALPAGLAFGGVYQSLGGGVALVSSGALLVLSAGFWWQSSARVR